MLPFSAVPHRFCPPFPETLWPGPGEYFRRILHFKQIDLEYTFAQLVYLIVSPRKVYQFVEYRKQTKGRWSRDDPGFVVIMVAFLMSSGLAYGVAFGVPFPALIIAALLPAVMFFVSGIIMSTIYYLIARKYLRVYSFRDVEEDIEWAFCFDIHCNSSFPVFVLCGALQFFFLPAILTPTLIPCVVSNALYAVSLCYYCYITSLGYKTLPFLDHTEVFMYPALPILCGALLLSICRISMTRVVLSLFVGWLRSTPPAEVVVASAIAALSNLPMNGTTNRQLPSLSLS